MKVIEVKNILFFSLLLFVACTEPIDIAEGSDILSELKIIDILFNGSEVTIDWTNVQSAQDQTVRYELFLNQKFIQELTESMSVLDLDYNTNYKAKIIATDSNDNSSELTFSFDTLTSEILFFSDHYGDLTAYDLLTNDILWKRETLTTEVHSIADNKVYSGIGGINAFNIFSGEQVWTYNPNPSQGKEYHDILADSTTVYAFDSSSNLHAVDVATKSTLWTYPFIDHTAPLALDDTHLFACGIDEDHLYAFNKLTGSVDWSFSLDDATSFNVNPLVTDTHIYVGDNMGVIYAIDKMTGIDTWSNNSGSTVPFSASPILSGDHLIIGTINTLYAYHKDTGVLQWSYTPSSGTLFSSPFITNDNVHITISDTNNSQVISLNALNGELNWAYDLTHDSMASPIIYNDVVYCNDLNKQLFAININSSSLDWQIKTNGIVTKSPTLVIGNSEAVVYPSMH
ncbi:MAG: PQQ-binding-like beta-propeller repeat protein, partial [Flavobacteriaceae bacterium]|nr:PQQ-binding-like beta-propeller repeat protein [Flavobacteriaceae bacterium]